MTLQSTAPKSRYPMPTPSDMEIASAYIKVDTKRSDAGLPMKPCITDKEILDYIYADFIEAHPKWDEAASFSSELASDIRSHVVNRGLARCWIEYLAEMVKAPVPEPGCSTKIEKKLWFVNRKRFGGRYTYTQYPIAVEAVISEQEIVINDVIGRQLGERYHMLTLCGDSERDLSEWEVCHVKSICRDTGDAQVYTGHVLEYRHGHDGMGGAVTTIKILLEDDKPS